jgi:UDP-N-acetylglucosamine--N-acetylmuramyl-(pentapeptide) pyrophosphoryl-undecaprenol N-acetylglucosamine transferase
LGKSPFNARGVSLTSKRTIMIMAGGTGGHVIPGLAVAGEMQRRHWEVVWLGHPKGMEAALTAKAGIPMRPVVFSGFRGKGLFQQALMPLNILRAFWQSVKALRDVKPQVVLGMGGYIALPGGLMASLLGKPLVVHEQNSVAGLTNKILSGVADRCLNAFPSNLAKSLPKGEWVGNPVRETLINMAEPTARYAARQGPLRLSIVGGSLGAVALNELVPQAMALIAKADRPVITHQSGRGRLAALEQAYKDAGVEAQCVEFIDDMTPIYEHSDLLICRAGAMTVSEIAAVGIASLMVPFPAAVDDHQTTNANFLVDAQAGLMMQQRDLSPDRLANAVTTLGRQALVQMACAARALAKPDATQKVADVCEAIALELKTQKTQ